MSLNAAVNATYQFDVINRLTQLTDNATLNTTFAYDATNKVTSRTLPNGVVSTYEYDGLNRLTRLKHAKGVNTLADFQYQFDTANNITQLTDGAGAHNYTYDSLDRLTAATHPAGQTNESYTYDDVGNRTASHQGSSYSYQAFNRLVSANGTTFGYDTNGNMLSQTYASGTWTYSRDYEKRLTLASRSGGVVVARSAAEPFAGVANAIVTAITSSKRPAVTATAKTGPSATRTWHRTTIWWNPSSASAAPAKVSSRCPMANSSRR